MYRTRRKQTWRNDFQGILDSLKVQCDAEGLPIPKLTLPGQDPQPASIVHRDCWFFSIIGCAYIDSSSHDYVARARRRRGLLAQRLRAGPGLRSCMGFVFDTKPGKNSEERDTPANILPSPIPPSLQALTAKELETIFWQASNHDACYTSVNLAQHFFGL
ncbi:hypothetical protein BDZ89DRAFT_1254872 [Hymenopellis radicata]|nr:hypothetical protein BDZ89DRAFT_1254872 [Hymenopellis radicata]